MQLRKVRRLEQRSERPGAPREQRAVARGRARRIEEEVAEQQPAAADALLSREELHGHLQ